MTVPIKLLNSTSVSYDIIIDTLPKLSFDTKVVIVTNPTVSSYHLDSVVSKIDARELSVVTVPDGEVYKSLESVEDILNQLFEYKLDRKSILIALGGGVIGDMTGFTASIYQRGISFIQIPTTLLSQVDASVGGKTGVNNRYGKNLIGAFYQPQSVYIDPTFLKTLPAREFSAGVAEIVKMAVMFDRSYFEFLQDADLGDDEVLKSVIKQSVELKAEVVSQDEKEAGIRAVLNYGHTFGHVIENETDYKTYLHGEAVSIGIVMANALAVKLGLMTIEQSRAVETLLKRFNLPTQYLVKDADSFYEQFMLDKKSENSKIKFILAKGIGEFSIEDSVDSKIVKNILKEFGEVT